MKKFALLLLFLLPPLAFASAGRTIDADAFINAKHTKTYTLPTTAPSSDTVVSLGATQTLGSGSTWNGVAIGAGFGGLGLTSITSGSVVVGNGTSPASLVAPGTSGNVLTSSGGTWVSQAASGGAATLNYYSGTMSSSSTWTTTSSTYADPSNSGGNTLTTIYSSGITVTAGASSVAGITFTPAASTSVYFISAVSLARNDTNNNGISMRLTDGTTAFAFAGSNAASNSAYPTPVQGIYAPGVGTAVTVKLQLSIGASAGGSAQINGNFAGNFGALPSIQWTVIQIK